jgi:hypothetical protein
MQTSPAVVPAKMNYPYVSITAYVYVLISPELGN